MPRYFRVRVLDRLDEINDCYLVADDSAHARRIATDNDGYIVETKTRETDVKRRLILEVEDQGEVTVR